MKIKDVLNAKGSRIVAVHYEQSADAIPALFVERNISSVVVEDADHNLLGLITDRQVMKALARRGVSLADLQASDLMLTPAPSCTPETTVADGMRKMTDEYVRHLVVLDGKRLAGIVSIGDLVKARLGDYEMESRVLRDMAYGHISAQA